MKRAVTVSLLLVLFLVSVVPLAQADDPPPPLIINVWQDVNDYDAMAGQEVIIRSGWMACTRGLEQQFLRAASVSMEVSLDGSRWLMVEPPSREYWDPPAPYEGDTSGCVMATRSWWSSHWLYSLGALTPGEYELRFIMAVSHPVLDGGDWDGDGRIDIGSGVFLDRTLTIHVS